MLAPSSEISGKSNCVKSLLENAGTDASVTSRTLKVQDRDAYNALVDKGLNENWQIGKCKVLDKDDKAITE